MRNGQGSVYKLNISLVILVLGTVPTVWYFLFLFVFTQKYIIEKKPIDIKWNIV
jgi:hypothetical protein